MSFSADPNYKKLIFLEIVTINEFSSGENSFLGKLAIPSWGVNIYSVDLLNKKISSKAKLLYVLNSGGTRQEKFNKTLNACIEELNN
jgi:hypothetical protein